MLRRKSCPKVAQKDTLLMDAQIMIIALSKECTEGRSEGQAM
jgi:hypothetical protein